MYRHRVTTSVGGRSARTAGVTVIPEPIRDISGTAPRGKRKRIHRPVSDAKRRREAAAAAAFEDMAFMRMDRPFSSPVEVPDPMGAG